MHQVHAGRPGALPEGKRSVCYCYSGFKAHDHGCVAQLIIARTPLVLYCADAALSFRCWWWVASTAFMRSGVRCVPYALHTRNLAVYFVDFVYFLM